MLSNFYADFLKSKIAKKIALKNSFLFRFSEIEAKLFFLFSIIFLLSFFYFRLEKLFGVFLFFLSLSILSLIKFLFAQNFLKSFNKKDGFFWNFEFEIPQALFRALKLKRGDFINSSLFLYFLLDEKNWKIRFILNRLLINAEKLKQELIKEKARDDLEKIFLYFQNGEKVKIGEILFILARENKIFSKFLTSFSLRAEEIKKVGEWVEYLENEFLERKKFWKFENLIKKGSIGRDWIAGYTPLLDRFSFDLTKSVKIGGFKKIFAHQKELEKVERILIAPQKNDVLIVGEAGSGRRSIVEGLARECAIGKSLPELNFKRVVYLDLQKLIAFAQNHEELETLLTKIFEQVSFAGNVILVIDEIHQYIGGKSFGPGRVEISPILLRFLPFKNFRVIGITNFEGLHKNLEKNSSFLEYFEKVEVSEVSEDETLLILEDRALRLEMKYKIFFTFQAIESAILYSAKFLQNLPFPEKAIEILDESAILVFTQREKIVFPAHVAKIVTQKTKIPVGEIEEKEREILLNLEKLLHQRVIDQEEAIFEIASALRRERAGIKFKKKPIGCFLFLGPTGVGKTETSKALAEIYFGSEEKMIRLDMSEYQNLNDIQKLLGGGEEEGILTTKVRENPFSLILLDEFEKANPKILDLFLQVFDEGHLRDGFGRKVDFRNSLIIATSNAGAEIIFKAFKEKMAFEKMKEKLINYIVENKIFKPELLNRFDGIILFKPLTKENLLEIADLILKKIQKNLKEKQIEFLVTQELKEKIVEVSFDPRFGAREMERVIQEKIGNVLAEAILKKEIGPSSKIKINPKNFKLEIL